MEYLQEVRDKHTGKVGIVIDVRLSKPMPDSKLGFNYERVFEYDVAFTRERHWLPESKLVAQPRINLSLDVKCKIKVKTKKKD